MSTTNRTHKSIELSDPLDSLPEGETLLTKVKALSKAGVSGWNEPENLITPRRAEQRLKRNKNYGFAAGRGTSDWKLVVLDVERKGVLPEKAQVLIDEHAVLTWDSVHEGRNRLVKVSPEAYEMLDSIATGHDHLSEKPGDDIEIQTNGHAIGPGCKIDHTKCSDTKQSCPGNGISEYEVVDRHQCAPVVTKQAGSDILDRLEIGYKKGVDSNKQSSSVEVSDLSESDSGKIEKMDGYMSKLQDKNGYLFNDLMDRLNGKKGKKSGLTLCQGYIDRSAMEFVTLSDLYGVARVIGDENEDSAKCLAYSYHDYYCRETPKTTGNRSRKWLEMNEKYRKNMINAAIKQFDRNQFYRWLRSCEEEKRPGLSKKDGSYSTTTRDCVNCAVMILTSKAYKKLVLEDAPKHIQKADLELSAEGWSLDLPDGTRVRTNKILSNWSGGTTTTNREYPTRKEIVQLAKFIDENHNKKSTYQKALGRLKKEGRVGLAFCPSYDNSERYVYYFNRFEEPDDPKWVERGGERTYK